MSIIDAERLAGALDVLSEEGLEYDLMAPEEREERYEAALQVAAEYDRRGDTTPPQVPPEQKR